MKPGEREIAEGQLLPIENQYQDREYKIHICLPEFTCKCPRTGYPDFATIDLLYIPDNYIVELKSLKLYINRFRDEYIFHEEAANRIIQDLVEALSPRWMRITADFNPRGNVHTVVQCEFDRDKGYVLSDRMV